MQTWRLLILLCLVALWHIRETSISRGYILVDFPFFSTRFGARYFNDAPPVFQRLFFTSEESSAVHYGPRRMKLRDLMGATLRFLHSDCAKFRMLWDWSPCMSHLLTSDVMVRWYVPCSLLDIDSTGIIRYGHYCAITLNVQYGRRNSRICLFVTLSCLNTPENIRLHV